MSKQSAKPKPAKPEPPEMTVCLSGWPPCPACKGSIGTIGYRTGGQVVCFGCVVGGGMGLRDYRAGVEAGEGRAAT